MARHREDIEWCDHNPPSYVPLLVQTHRGVRVGYYSSSMATEPYTGHSAWIVDGLPLRNAFVLWWARMPEGPS